MKCILAIFDGFEEYVDLAVRVISEGDVKFRNLSKLL